jgi:hypothetical protein
MLMKAAMIRTFLLNLGISSALCVGERLLERLAFPGLHRTVARMAATDPSRADDMATIIAEAIGLLAIVWLFNLTLYAIGFLTRRPLKPQVPTLVAVVIVALTFAGAYGQWSTLPSAPVAAPTNAQ